MYCLAFWDWVPGYLLGGRVACNRNASIFLDDFFELECAQRRHAFFPLINGLRPDPQCIGDSRFGSKHENHGLKIVSVHEDYVSTLTY